MNQDTAALATQPATSQPEEAWMNDPLSLDSGLPATSQDGEGAMAIRQRLLSAAHLESKEPESHAFRHLAKYGTDTAILALAATPTPPTLSEDLRAVLEFYADRDGDGYRVDVTNYGLSTEEGEIVRDGGKRARAALAQVKAS